MAVLKNFTCHDFCLKFFESPKIELGWRSLPLLGYDLFGSAVLDRSETTIIFEGSNRLSSGIMLSTKVQIPVCFSMFHPFIECL